MKLKDTQDKQSFDNLEISSSEYYDSKSKNNHDNIKDRKSKITCAYFESQFWANAIITNSINLVKIRLEEKANNYKEKIISEKKFKLSKLVFDIYSVIFKCFKKISGCGLLYFGRNNSQ